MQVQEQDVTQEEAAAMSRGGADIVAGQKYWSKIVSGITAIRSKMRPKAKGSPGR
jgi:hypothetical protein